MIHIAVCDDDNRILWGMSEQLEKLGKKNKVPLEVETYQEGGVY